MKYKDNKNMRGFTLIELIVVLVILALLALIVTPLVMNIIAKTKASANKRSIDGYGKSLELAISVYKMDNGYYPDNLDNLDVSYSGSNVKCNEKILNKDGSIYLSKCYVGKTKVKDLNTEDGYYHYGRIVNDYSVGDVITYNDMDFYVINNSNTSLDYVTLLKEIPLTVDEVNKYGGVRTDNNHVNMYIEDTTSSYYQKAYDNNGYGGMLYYSSSMCGYNGSSWVSDSCTTDYAQSEVKYVVDAWALDKFSNSDLVEDATGYTTRILMFDELTNNLGYEFGQKNPSTTGWIKTENTPSWVYNENYGYWTMSSYEDSTSRVWHIDHHGDVGTSDVSSDGISNVVRPVINLKKSVIEE